MIFSLPSVPRIAGFYIYKITNLVNGKFYIGSAVNLRLRMNGHRTRLNVGTHKNRHLQAAWKLYGRDSFKFAEGSIPVRRLCFSPDCRALAIIRGDPSIVDKSIELWDVAGRRRIRTLDLHPSQIRAVAFSGNGSKLAAGYYDGTLDEWDLNTGSKGSLEDARVVGVVSIAYSPDGRTLATVGWDPYIRLWDLATGKVLARMRSGFSGSGSLAFSNDGRRLIVGGERGVVALWDLAGPVPQEVARLKQGESTVYFVGLLPGGDTLVAWDRAELCVWRAPSSAQITTSELEQKPITR